jgi:hypothetical protein
MSSNSSDASRHVPTRVQPRRLSRKRNKFLLLSLAAVAVLSTALAVSFTADSGVTSIGVTGTAGSQYVYAPTYGSVGTLPTVGGVGLGDTAVANKSWAYGTASGFATSPVWSGTGGNPSLGAGYIKTGGDVALIDARNAPTANLVVSVYITNLGQLMADYSSFAFPIELYQGSVGAPAVSGRLPITWTRLSVGPSPSITFLTDSGGVLSWKVPAGSASNVYEVVMTGATDTAPVNPAAFSSGGAFFIQAVTNTTTAALAPSFYVTADEAA